MHDNANGRNQLVTNVVSQSVRILWQTFADQKLAFM
jgi:hypothetical protein